LPCGRSVICARGLRGQLAASRRSPRFFRRPQKIRVPGREATPPRAAWLAFATGWRPDARLLGARSRGLAWRPGQLFLTLPNPDSYNTTVLEPLELPADAKTGLLARLGGHVLLFLAYFGRLLELHAYLARLLLRLRIERALTVAQMAAVGVASLPIVAVTTLLSGMVIGYHVAVQAGQLGVSPYAGWLVAETMARELGPVLAAFVVAARAGSAMTAELGTMKATEQIDALRALATDPVEYLVVPRYLACVAMLPLLTFLGDVVGVLGGYVMAIISPHINHQVYFSAIPSHLKAWTVIAGILKTVVFGMVVALVCCYEGLSCRPASEEVGRATTRAVVYCIMLIYLADLILTAILFPG
jgi:phospholipid/cholesterol/gamma-HCH transport system permease protein